MSEPSDPTRLEADCATLRVVPVERRLPRGAAEMRGRPHAEIATLFATLKALGYDRVSLPPDYVLVQLLDRQGRVADRAFVSPACAALCLGGEFRASRPAAARPAGAGIPVAILPASANA
jgi:hypothetical protein